MFSKNHEFIEFAHIFFVSNPSIWYFVLQDPHLAGDTSTAGRFGLGEAVVEPRKVFGNVLLPSDLRKKGRSTDIRYPMYTYLSDLYIIYRHINPWILWQKNVANSKPIIHEELSVVDHPLEETPASWPRCVCWHAAGWIQPSRAVWQQAANRDWFHSMISWHSQKAIYKDQKIWRPCFFELLSWPETWSRWAIHGSKQEGNCHRNMTKIEKRYKTIPIISKDQPWNIVKCSSARIQRPAHVWAPSPPTNRTDHSATKNKTELCRYATESFVEIFNTSSVNWHLLMTYFQNKYECMLEYTFCRFYEYHSVRIFPDVPKRGIVVPVLHSGQTQDGISSGLQNSDKGSSNVPLKIPFNHSSNPSWNISNHSGNHQKISNKNHTCI